MKTSTQLSKALLTLVVLVGLSLQGCIKDACNMVYTHAVYTPKYMTSSEFRSAVKTLPPQSVVNPGKIYVKDQLLLVNEIAKGVHIFDNKNPAAPISLGFIAAPGNYDIAFNCGNMYLDSSIDILVFDMNDPTNPRLVNRVQNALPHIVEYNGYVADESKGIVVEWVKEIKEDQYNCEAGVPELWELNEVPTTEVIDLGNNNTRTINPATPGKGGSMSRFTVSKDHLYIALPHHMVVYDASNCESLSKVQSIELPQMMGEAEMITTMNDLLLVGANSGLSIYNNTNPELPGYEGEFDHAEACDPVSAREDYAFVTLRNGAQNFCGTGFTNQLDVISIANPRQPSLVRTYPMHNPHGLSLDGDYLFIADGAEGLKVFNAADVYRIEQVGHFPGMQGYDVIAHQGVLVLVGPDGIAQYDYSNPEDISLLSTIQVSE